jgi:hypothetical protein
MFHSHYSNFFWTELLFKLVSIPFLALLLLLLSSQLIRLQHLPSVTPPTALHQASDRPHEIDF